jgi:hypothetical protein
MHWRDLISFEPLVERLKEIDHKLAWIDEVPPHEVDALGYLDDAEELVGDGFLAMQLYMIECKGEVDNKEAYDRGPKHNAYFFADLFHGLSSGARRSTLTSTSELTVGRACRFGSQPGEGRAARANSRSSRVERL